MTIATPGRRRAHRHKTFAACPELSTAKVFATLVSDLAVAPDLNQVVSTVLECAVATVHCDWAAIQLQPAGQSPAVSDPCFATTGGSRRVGIGGQPAVMLTSHTAVDQQWPPWSADLFGRGIRSAYVVELTASRSVVGTIAFCATQPDRFGPHDRAAARVLAVHAALAIVAIRTAATLAEAIESSTIIGQALGIVMERCETDNKAAFALLRACSHNTNLTIRDVAQTLVVTRRLPDDPAVPMLGRLP